MGTGLGPYLGTDAGDTDNTGAGSPVIETTLIATRQLSVDICGGALANVEVFSGAIPGSTFRLNVNDAVVVRLINQLPYQHSEAGPTQDPGELLRRWRAGILCQLQPEFTSHGDKEPAHEQARFGCCQENPISNAKTTEVISELAGLRKDYVPSEGKFIFLH